VLREEDLEAPESDVPGPPATPPDRPHGVPEGSAEPAREEAPSTSTHAGSRLPHETQAPHPESPDIPAPHAVPEVVQEEARPVERDLDPEQVKAQVFVQLCTTRQEDIASRKKRYKALCLQWHPDKNQDHKKLSEEVFKFLQDQRGYYLAE